jgi:carbon-monoxide dehydrogenase small subunit
MTHSPTHKIDVKVNGKTYTKEVEPRMLLSDFLRHELDLTGTLLNGEPIRSCLMFAIQVNGDEIETVEGLSSGDEELHPLQQAFWDAHGLQCGFCTPGILMTVVAFLKENPDPTEMEIREAISGNLCRCTGYQNIVSAVKLVAERGV